MALVHVGPFPKVEAGSYPPELVQACKVWAVQPAALLDWAVKLGEVVMILPSGQKVSVGIVGGWKNLSPSPSPEGGGEREEALERLKQIAADHAIPGESEAPPAKPVRARPRKGQK